MFHQLVYFSLLSMPISCHFLRMFRHFSIDFHFDADSYADTLFSVSVISQAFLIRFGFRLRQASFR